MRTSKVNGASKALPQKFPYRRPGIFGEECLHEKMMNIDLRKRTCKTHTLHPCGPQPI